MITQLLVTSGRGPAECRLAVDVVWKMIVAETQAVGVDAGTILGDNHPQGHGPASVVVTLDGPDEAVADILARWSGSVQWIAQSPIRRNHKRKNWFVSVSELPLTPEDIELDESEVTFEAFRAGGPGGQHQNTTDSAVRAAHAGTGIAVTCRDQRSQHQNKKVALRRLAAAVKSRNDLDRGAIRDLAQERHNNLERGNPVRVIRA
jgi:peptide chain release factor